MTGITRHISQQNPARDSKNRHSHVKKGGFEGPGGGSSRAGEREGRFRGGPNRRNAGRAARLSYFIGSLARRRSLLLFGTFCSGSDSSWRLCRWASARGERGTKSRCFMWFSVWVMWMRFDDLLMSILYILVFPLIKNSSWVTYLASYDWSGSLTSGLFFLWKFFFKTLKYVLRFTAIWSFLIS